MSSEADVMRSIKARLEHYQFAKVVIWYTRLQSFKIKHFGNWIQGCEKGTPDFIALVRDKHNTITILFIEAKSSTGGLWPEQRDFMTKYDNNKDVLYFVITDPKKLDSIINAIGVDRTNELPTEVG